MCAYFSMCIYLKNQYACVNEYGTIKKNGKNREGDFSMRRSKLQMTEDWAREIIMQCEYGVLGTADATGVPYCVAVSHVLMGDKLYFHCALAGRKIENMQENPKVCMSFVGRAKVLREKYTVGYESAIVEGIATMVTDPEEKMEALLLICKRYALESEEANMAYIMPMFEKTGVCRIDITAVSGKSNKKG